VVLRLLLSAVLIKRWFAGWELHRGRFHAAEAIVFILQLSGRVFAH